MGRDPRPAGAVDLHGALARARRKVVQATTGTATRKLPMRRALTAWRAAGGSSRGGATLSPAGGADRESGRVRRGSEAPRAIWNAHRWRPLPPRRWRTSRSRSRANGRCAGPRAPARAGKGARDVRRARRRGGGRGRERAAGTERRELPPTVGCDPSGDKPEGTSRLGRTEERRLRLGAQGAPASLWLTFASRTGEMLPKEAARSSSLTAQGRLPT